MERHDSGPKNDHSTSHDPPRGDGTRGRSPSRRDPPRGDGARGESPSPHPRDRELRHQWPRSPAPGASLRLRLATSNTQHPRVFDATRTSSRSSLEPGALGAARDPWCLAIRRAPPPRTERAGTIHAVVLRRPPRAVSKTPSKTRSSNAGTSRTTARRTARRREAGLRARSGGARPARARPTSPARGRRDLGDGARALCPPFSTAHSPFVHFGQTQRAVG